MAVLRIVTLVAVSVTVLSTCAVCRPASDDATDFAIDDAPVAEPGPPAMFVSGSGEENPETGSGEGDAEEDMVSSGEELVSGSASGAPAIEVGIARTVNKSAPVFTTLRQNTPSSTTVRSETSFATVLSEMSSATVHSMSSTTIVPERPFTTVRSETSSMTVPERSSTTVQSETSSRTVHSVPSATTVPERSSTTVRSETSSTTVPERSSTTVHSETSSTTVHSVPSATTVPERSSTTVRSETSSTTVPERSSTTVRSETSSTTVRAQSSRSGGVFINLEDESGSGAEDDPEPETTTEAPEDVVSGSGIDWPLEKSLNRFTSVRPSDGLDTTDVPTLSPEVGIKEELIPVTVGKTPKPAYVNTTIAVSPVPTTIPESSPKETTLPTPTKSLNMDSKSGETTPESDSSTHSPTTGVEKPHSSTHAQNHTRRIEGRRRRPIHHDTTPAISYEDVSVAEAKEEDEDDNKVSYFAVIAAALVSAIVFFALGYLASILKDKRRRLTLPWKKDRVTLERSIADPGNGSATQVYRDTNPDRVTSVYDPVNASGKPKQNGSTERMPTNDLAEVHPKPPHLTEPDTVTNVSPTNEASPKISTTSDEVAQVPSSRDATDEMKYMDETDDDMEPPVASTPLLPDQSPEEAERGDLATQVLSTVDKNLNTDPDAKAPLLTDSTKDNTSSGNRSPV